jgi:hypothetical protein
MKRNKLNINTIERTEPIDMFNRRWTHYLMIGILIVVISVLFYRIGFMKMAPVAHDTQQWRWASQQIIEHNAENPDTALWTDNMFGGMPSYLLMLPLKFPYLNNVFFWLDFLISWRVLYLIFGGLGMYILLIRQKLPPLVALFSAFAFAISCHFIGLIEIGHNTKLRAIMYLPWIFWGLEELRQNRRMISIGLLSIFLIDQLRVNHFQICYYTYIMIFIYWIFFGVEAVKRIDKRNYAIFTGLLCLALLIAVLAVANPYLSVYEYSFYTSRGSTGLTTDYATSWSFGVGEVLSFLVPSFYGGISPLYWGPMPFTQTFHYMGILVFFLAILATVCYWKDTRIKALAVVAFICILMSFGKHFPFLSNLLLNYLPLFNKFRVPAMILCIVQFIFPVLAAFGLKLCIDNIRGKSESLSKVLFISLIVSIGCFMLFVGGENIFSSLSLTSESDSLRYQPGQIEQLRMMRLEALMSSGMRSFAILIGGLLSLFLMVKGFLKKNIALIVLVTLVVLDLSLVNQNHLKPNTLVPESSIQREFEELETDRFLRNDQSLYRIFPFHEFQNARWSYFHQSIGGYHGAKLHRYNEIIERNLHAELSAGIPINWNIIDMMNVKYLIFNSRVNIPNADIELVYFEPIDRNKQYAVYENHRVLPRAWFVNTAEVITDRDRISLRLNDPDFDPERTVILEKAVPDFEYRDSFQLEIIERNIHYTRWQSQNRVPGFMVVSEIFYQAGWNFYINGEKTECYPANYFLRGLVVPAGTNTIEMIFEPTSYKISLVLSAIGLFTSILLTGIGFFAYRKKNFGSGIVYKVEL